MISILHPALVCNLSKASLAASCLPARFQRNQKTLGETVPVLRVITRPITHTCNSCFLLPSAALCIHVTSPTICQTRRRSRNMPELNWTCLKCTRTNVCGVRLRHRSSAEETRLSSVVLFMIRGQNRICSSSQSEEACAWPSENTWRSSWMLDQQFLTVFAASGFLNLLPIFVRF